MKTTEQSPQLSEHAEDKYWLAAVRTQVNSLRFGVVQIVVHDARVVQIEKTEKIRFKNPEH